MNSAYTKDSVGEEELGNNLAITTNTANSAATFTQLNTTSLPYLLLGSMAMVSIKYLKSSEAFILLAFSDTLFFFV